MKTAALKVTTPSERELVMTRDFDAPRGMVFDALTKPELVQRWLLGPPGWTMPVCEIDLRVGGKYRYVWKNADGRTMGMGGTFTDIVEKKGKSTITTTVRYSSRAARDAALKTGMTTGMEAGYERLEQLLQETAHG